MNLAADGSPAGGPLDWLFLDLNSYFASVEQQERPELRGRPVIVVPVESNSTCAIAASHAAKRFGIKTFVLPSRNKADLAELPPEVRGSMQFVPAETLDDVLAVALPTPVPAA